ncbi:MAG: SMC-Scp complex subunit ScpB [Acidobacteriota bacterium]
MEDTLEKEKIKSIIESLIFASHEPLNVEKIKNVLSEYDSTKVERAIDALIEDYSNNKRGIVLRKIGGGYEFYTNPEYEKWVRNVSKPKNFQKLSQASLETLASIAYKGPLTLSEISFYRGVNSSSPLRTLLDKKLVRIVGKKNSPGRPSLYGLTKEFFKYFGIDSIEDLPSIEEIASIIEEK